MQEKEKSFKSRGKEKDRFSRPGHKASVKKRPLVSKPKENRSSDVTSNKESKLNLDKNEKKVLTLLDEKNPVDGSSTKISIPVFQKYPNAIIGKEMVWYKKVPEVERSKQQFNQANVEQLKEVAAKLWENEREIWEKKLNADKSSDANWLRTVFKSGTMSDKVAAFTMVLQESPVHAKRSLETLLTMTKKKARRESLIAIDSLRHLWVTNLLPDRKLKYFNQWPLASLAEIVKDGNKMSIDRLLIFIFFEDYLKGKYSEFIDILERHLQDNLMDIRKKVLGVVYELLAMKPEEEQRLLKLLVNKVGDPDRKVASQGSFYLTELVAKHPNMKAVVTDEMERLLFRKNISEKAQYYGICFLNQLILTSKDKELASKLISIFFAFFKVYASKTKAQSKMLSALLTGVNRAFPFAKDEDEKYEEQLNMLFRVAHVTDYGTSTQALMLLYQVMDVRQSVSDRFYQAVYEKILNREEKSVHKQGMFLNLLFKSLKNDPSVNRVKAFVKRLLQSCCYENQSYACGVLYLLSELLKGRPEVKSILMQPEEEDDEEHFTDVIMDEDKIGSREETDDHSENKSQNREDDTVQKEKQRNYATSMVNDVRVKCYETNARNPLYCGAQFSCAWETLLLSDHFHPSVEHFVKTILQNKQITYEGDPLQDFTVMRFLDRFIYKNPKQGTKAHGRSIMQPKTTSVRLKEQPVNSVAFLKKKEEDVREDELFFYKFFHRKSLLEGKKTPDKRKRSLQDEDTINEEQLENDGEVDDFDFASELKKSKIESKKTKKGKKGKKEESESDQSEFEGDFDGEDEDFDYDNMEFSDEEDSTLHGANEKQWTDKDYEKALLENLTSEDESEDREVKKGKKGKNTSGDTSMFAAAEEFAHLLEDVRRHGAKTKEAKWEQLRGEGTQGDKYLQRKRKDWNSKTKAKQKGNRNNKIFKSKKR